MSPQLVWYTYTAEDLAQGGVAQPGERRPALVVKDHGDGTCNLQVFTDGPNDFEGGHPGQDGLLRLERRTIDESSLGSAGELVTGAGGGSDSQPPPPKGPKRTRTGKAAE
jgi:hypothetical protein